MSERNKQITDLFLRADIQKIISNTARGDSYYREELTSELFLILCDLPEEKLNQEYKNGILAFIGKICANQFKSRTSDFYRKIKRPRLTDDCPDNIPDKDDNYHELLENVSREVSKLPEYDRIIIQYLAEGLNIKQIALRTKVNRQYISQAIARIKKDLKFKIRKDL